MYGAELLVWGLILKTCRNLSKGRPGILHGALMDVLQDAHGQIMEAFSISAGLDYPGVGPEHCYFNEIGRATYDSITDEEALEGFKLLSRLEGIIQLLSLAMPLRLRKKWQLRCRQTKASSSASQVVGTRTLCRLKNVSKLKQKGNKP